jgi:hypothetical protein
MIARALGQHIAPQTHSLVMIAALREQQIEADSIAHREDAKSATGRGNEQVDVVLGERLI